MKSISAISLLATSLAITSVNADIGFKINTATCDGDPFTDLDIDITCYGYNRRNCLFGDVAIIEGQVEAITSFDNSTEMIFKACIWGHCPEENIRSAGSLCGDWLTPIENQTCGEAGMYNVSNTEVIIPEADIPNSWSWLVKVIIGVEQECEAGGTNTESTNAYSYDGMTYSMMGALIGTAFGISYAARSRMECDGGYGDDDEDDNERSGAFIEMNDAACGAEGCV
ncbi:hypothetical protein ACHAXR_007210 [Thalassiosira sp. AJA248-18]